MIDLERFAIFTAAASAVFLTVLAITVRKRAQKPNPALLTTLTLIVVAGGMIFARYGHILFQFPWWIYYGLPAALTFFLPPFALRMKPAELLRYIPMAVLMAPAIHVLFSLFVGWHDYMPFPIYIPSLATIMHPA